MLLRQHQEESDNTNIGENTKEETLSALRGKRKEERLDRYAGEVALLLSSMITNDCAIRILFTVWFEVESDSICCSA